MDLQHKSLQKNGLIMIIALIVQYIFGVATAFFVKFPESATVAQYWQFANTQFVLAFHMALGLGLVIGGIVLFVRAIKQQHKTWKLASGLGLFFIIVAGIGGERFVPSQADGWSFLMALGFMAALICYGWGLYSSKEIL